MSADLESTLLFVWQQALIDKKKSVELGFVLARGAYSVLEHFNGFL
jgi:hypothetical protein